MPSEIAAKPALAAAVRTLVIDAAAVECISALRADGVRAILLKGPVIARWLYSDAGLRDYTDVDLLVASAEFPQARRMLEGLGYRDSYADWSPSETPAHARVFSPDRSAPAKAGGRSPAGPPIDLHWSFHGIGVPDQEFWTTVAESAERMRIFGTEVDIPNEPTRTMLLALHAATPGAHVGHPLEDLDRGLERLPADTWRAAHALAVRLDAVPRFLAGLVRRPLGRKLIDDLHLEGGMDVRSALYAAGIPPTAAGLERLTQTRGVGPRMRLLARELIPTRSFMRSCPPEQGQRRPAWSRLARRGSLGLAVAYAYRPAWLLIKLPAALRAQARARRTVRAGGPREHGAGDWDRTG